MAAAAVDVPDIGCFEKTRAGPPGLGSAATRRRRRGRIGARLFARRPGMMVTGWKCMCDDLVVQLFWRGLCTEAGEHGSKYLLGQQQLEESAELLLRIVRGQQGGGGGDNDTAVFLPESISRDGGEAEFLPASVGADGIPGSSPGSSSGGSFAAQVDVEGNDGSNSEADLGIQGFPESISGGFFSARGDVEGDGSPGSISGGFFSTEGDVAGTYIAGSPGNISGGFFSARRDGEGKEGLPESISGETHFLPEVAESGGIEESGCSKSLLTRSFPGIDGVFSRN